MPHDLENRPRHRIAPLAAAIGVIIAATIGLVLARISPPAEQPPAPSISTTAH